MQATKTEAPAEGPLAHSRLLCHASRGLRRQHRLDPDFLGQPRLERGEFRTGLDGVMAWMRQVDGDLGLDASRPCRHDKHARTEEDRFLDIVGHEQYRLWVAPPAAE